jgi:hypothetical protein
MGPRSLPGIDRHHRRTMVATRTSDPVKKIRFKGVWPPPICTEQIKIPSMRT